MQLERLYKHFPLFFPLRLHLGYSVALLAIAWWDPWWSLHEKLVSAPDVLFDLLTFPWGQFSRFIMDWSRGRTCRPNHGQLGYVTLWQERDGPGIQEERALCGPDHQTTCAQIHQIPHTHRQKWNPCPGQQHQHGRPGASWGPGWRWVHPPCLDEVLWCCVPLSSCKLPILAKQLLAILSWPQLSQSYLLRWTILFHLIPSYSSPFWEGFVWSILTSPSRKPLKPSWKVWFSTFRCSTSFFSPNSFHVHLSMVNWEQDGNKSQSFSNLLFLGLIKSTYSATWILQLQSSARYNELFDRHAFVYDRTRTEKTCVFNEKVMNIQTIRESLPIYFSSDDILIYTIYRSSVSFDNLNCGQYDLVHLRCLKCGQESFWQRLLHQLRELLVPAPLDFRQGLRVLRCFENKMSVIHNYQKVHDYRYTLTLYHHFELRWEMKVLCMTRNLLYRK